MVTISKPLAATQARRYHANEFSNPRENYYSRDGSMLGQWHGQLAAELGLTGAVSAEQFSRMAEGQDLHTGEQLIQHRERHEYKNERGEAVKSTEHRAGWDATFSAPKSVSLTALVGGDSRITEAHQASVKSALDEMERYVQARMGGTRPARTTGKWAVAMFEHDTARPVAGYAAPQLHTHCVFFNMTTDDTGKRRALDPRELFESQQLATAVYQSELARQLRGLGYEVEAGRNGAPEIAGYTAEYVEANSRRSEQIREHLKQEDLSGSAAAAQIAAHRTRESKAPESREAVRAAHLTLSERHGFQERAVMRNAAERHRTMAPGVRAENRTASSLTYARDRNLERDAVAGERTLLKDALRRGAGHTTVGELRTEIAARVARGELVAVSNSRSGQAQFTTKELLAIERANLAHLDKGRDHFPALSTPGTSSQVEMSHLSDQQQAAVKEILASRDQISGLEGRAGTGKTTTLAVVRQAAVRAGFEVQGLAPTSRAAQQLSETGMECGTLQSHLVRPIDKDAARTLFVVDEASLISTKQMNQLLAKLRPEDRLLLVGDSRQHEAVEAGSPFAQFARAGMKNAHLDQIVRQKSVELRQVVNNLSEGQVREAYDQLRQQGRVNEIPDSESRIQQLAKDYLKEPRSTLVVSPDNRSRIAINTAIRQELQRTGQIDSHEVALPVLVTRQEVTGADRQWAAQYNAGDVIRYSSGSKSVGVKKGEYARVISKDVEANTVTVLRADGSVVSYDPRRLHGVSLYREEQRKFARGDRIQFTSPDKTLRVANRELGHVQGVDPVGNLHIATDAGRRITIPAGRHLHIDHGHAVTSYSSQGLTCGRVLIHADSRSPKELVNSRFAYVAASRGRVDIRFYTDNAAQLGSAMGRDESKRSALSELEKARDRYRNTGQPSRDPHRPTMGAYDFEIALCIPSFERYCRDSALSSRSPPTRFGNCGILGGRLTPPPRSPWQSCSSEPISLAAGYVSLPGWARRSAYHWRDSVMNAGGLRNAGRSTTNRRHRRRPSLRLAQFPSPRPESISLARQHHQRPGRRRYRRLTICPVRCGPRS